MRLPMARLIQGANRSSATRILPCPVMMASRRPRSAQGALREDSRLPDYELIVGLETGGGRKAYPLEELRKQSVVNDQVGTMPVVLIHVSDSDTTTAFARRVAGRVLTFKPVGRNARELLDAETGSRWTAYGECTSGPLKGARLETLIPLPSFWFSWAEFFPGTGVYSPRGG